MCSNRRLYGRRLPTEKGALLVHPYGSPPAPMNRFVRERILRKAHHPSRLGVQSDRFARNLVGLTDRRDRIDRDGG
jgi:hypothetical protein